ncbi:MAG: hypothetical protein K6U03_02230 [Firmicutes bacterium]|nr:hypothetical protein [Bacillota bacterium]
MGRVEAVVMIVFDTKWNVGVYVSVSTGSGFPTIGGGVNVQVSTAKNIYSLQGGVGSEVQFGISGPVVGVEGFIGSNISYGGVNVSAGVQLPE